MSMASSFEYNAPNYIDFEDPNPVDDSDGADIFFDVETEIQSAEKENVQPATTANTTSIDSSKANPPISQDTKVILDDATQPERISSNLKRRSILKAARRMSIVKTDPDSSTDIKNDVDIKNETNPADNLSDSLTKLNMKPRKRAYFEGIEIKIKEEKPHQMTTRTDTATNASRLSLRSREVMKEEVAQNRKRKGDPSGMEIRSLKYIAMAENVLHFQKDTPPRFHSRPSNIEDKQRQLMFKKRQSYRPGPTVAKTPNLLTRTRARPSMMPSQVDREISELEEARRHKIKALPLNEKIFHQPQPLKKPTRQSTVIQPFHLTEIVKKPTMPQTEVFQFKARPLPKKILEGPTGVRPKPEIPLTVPESPAITKRPIRHAVTTWTEDKKQRQEAVGSFGVPLNSALLQNTVVQPFSFEQRDKLLMEKKEKKIQEILEEEKKARQFKAKPAPAFLPPREAHTSKCSIASSAADTSLTPYQFRARSPVVLRAKPFKPVTEGKHSKPLEVALNTERRAVERQDFELKMMDREERNALYKEQAEMEKKEQEAREIARLRKEATHKANPMPTYPPPPGKVNSRFPLTEPKSPLFTKRSRPTPIDSN